MSYAFSTSHRLPPVLSPRAVWLRFRFARSYRDLGDPRAERGIDASYETVGQWMLKCDAAYARPVFLRPRPPSARRRGQGQAASDDLPDSMIRAKYPASGRQMTAQDLLHNMQFFIVAGHEPTELALCLALYLLASDSEAQVRAQAEAQAALGVPAATAGDLEAMPNGRAVLKEAMRLYTPGRPSGAQCAGRRSALRSRNPGE